MLINCLLRGVDARSVSARKLLIRTMVCAGGEALEPVKCDLFVPGELPEDVQLLKKSYPVCIAAEAGEKSFTLEDELVLPSNMPDVGKLLSAMDLFVLPSRYEGLGIVLVEAQASGLHCVVSEGLTEEMNALGMVKYVSLEETPAVWATALIEAATMPRHDTYDQTISSGFDINTTTPWLQNFYLNKHNQQLSENNNQPCTK